MYKRIFSTGLLVLAAVVLLLGLAACDETDAANEYSQSLNNSEEQPLSPKMTTSGEEMLSGDVIPSGEIEPSSEIVTSGEEMSPGEGYGKGGRGQGRAQNNAVEPEAYQQNEEQTPDEMGTGRTSEMGQADLTYGLGSSQGQGKGQGAGGGRGSGGGQGSREPLSDAEIQGLVRAIEEEFGAQALYQSILDKFGNETPFNDIVLSEARHASALINQAQKYGIPVPEFPSSEGLPAFETVTEACQAGVDAEIADAELYDELMSFTTNSALIRVYTNLQKASLDSHLPAFEDCS
ncbi:MAG: DUF2202 domain-containing protein [Anaerolineales bacterium]